MPSGTLHGGDNLAWMRTLPDGGCDLIYADPPFLTGRVQGPAQNAETQFDDRWCGGIDDYLAFLTPRLEQMRRLLSDRGNLYVHLDWRTSHHVRLVLDGLFGADAFLNEIIWSYRSGGRSGLWFARKHDTILLYARCPGRHIFHQQRGGTYRTDGLHLDEKGRPYKNTTHGRLYFHPDGPAVTDVWEIPILSTVARERRGSPSQKPEALLERIIAASSDPGSTVGDFFCGSGTTPVVAARLGRRFLGCDSNSAMLEITRRRLAELGVDVGEESERVAS